MFLVPVNFLRTFVALGGGGSVSSLAIREDTAGSPSGGTSCLRFMNVKQICVREKLIVFHSRR